MKEIITRVLISWGILLLIFLVDIHIFNGSYKFIVFSLGVVVYLLIAEKRKNL